MEIESSQQESSKSDMVNPELLVPNSSNDPLYSRKNKTFPKTSTKWKKSTAINIISPNRTQDDKARFYPVSKAAIRIPLEMKTYNLYMSLTKYSPFIFPYDGLDSPILNKPHPGQQLPPLNFLSGKPKYAFFINF
jgi:hypothetical protein